MTEKSRPELTRGKACVLLALDTIEPELELCLESVFAHTPDETPVAIASTLPASELHNLSWTGEQRERIAWLVSPAPSADDGAGTPSGALARAVELLAPADIALLSKPSIVSDGWLERLRAAAYADSTTASASALSDAGTPLALFEADHPAEPPARLAERVVAHTLELRPRLNKVVGPCVYLRRDAFELVGPLDSALELCWALEVDFSQRCLLSGLAHVAADDVLVGALTPERGEEALPQQLRARYPYLSDPPAIAASGTLPRALEAARRPRPHLWVTIDTRALTGTLTGTQRHILELVRALSASGRLRLRLVISADTSLRNVELLRALPQTELLAIEQIDESTPRSTVFHRPQQIFGPPDLLLALRLGDRIVLNQLDLIAYRNPGYHRSATAWHSHRRASRQALAAADRVIVFSEHTRAELLGDELVDAERVRVVPPGLDHPLECDPSPPQGFGRVCGASSGFAESEQRDGFLFCLGTDFRHKNRVFALRLLAALRECHDWHGRLVLAGTHVTDGSSLALEREYLMANPQLREHIVDIGAIEEPEKQWLMGNAAAVVYPSVYEGFGLVPFEAALSGVPCLYAAQSSLAEVLPVELATLVPWSARESAQRTIELLRDEHARRSHVERLADAANGLTWNTAAAAMLELYEEAAIAPLREAATMSRGDVEREQQLRELVSAQDAHVVQLVEEREHARGMYHALNAEVGSGLSLIGPRGALPEELQRGLLALSARPALSRPLFTAGAHLFRAARAVLRRLHRGARGVA